MCTKLGRTTGCMRSPRLGGARVRMRIAPRWQSTVESQNTSRCLQDCTSVVARRAGGVLRVRLGEPSRIIRAPAVQREGGTGPLANSASPACEPPCRFTCRVADHHRASLRTPTSGRIRRTKSGFKSPDSADQIAIEILVIRSNSSHFSAAAHTTDCLLPGRH